MKATILAILAFTLACGCSFVGKRLTTTQVGANETEKKLQEESRALTTAVVDVLSVAPTNAHTELALELARRDQQIEGLPVERIDVMALLERDKAARAQLLERFAHQQALLHERAEQQAKVDTETERLVAMGKLYEKERNTNIVKRVWRWTFSTLGIGGLIALAIFCPAVIPILGRIAAWIAGRIPSVASFLGMVGQRALDATVKGIGEVRYRLKEQINTPRSAQPMYTPEQVLAMIDKNLSTAQDNAPEARILIDHRRAALNL